MAEIALLKRIAGGEEFRGPEPLHLWLLPVHLRSRQQYYQDLVAEVHRRIEDMWDFHGFMFNSREEFERAGGPDNVWRTLSPAWWGFADIVGFIDVRMHATEIAANLFSTKQRPSKVMKEKSYVFRRAVSVAIDSASSNETIKSELISAVERLAGDPAIKRRYLDLSRWRPLVEVTDIMALYRREYA